MKQRGEDEMLVLVIIENGMRTFTSREREATETLNTVQKARLRRKEKRDGL